QACVRAGMRLIFARALARFFERDKYSACFAIFAKSFTRHLDHFVHDRTTKPLVSFFCSRPFRAKSDDNARGPFGSRWRKSCASPSIVSKPCHYCDINSMG